MRFAKASDDRTRGELMIEHMYSTGLRAHPIHVSVFPVNAFYAITRGVVLSKSCNIREEQVLRNVRWYM